MSEPQRRRLHLLVPDDSYAHLLVAGDGRLPELELELTAPTTAAAATLAFEDMGIHAVLVDYVIDQSFDVEGAPIPVVAELQLLGGALPDVRWVALDDVVVDVSPPLATYVAARLAEWRGDATPPANRSPWAHRGWFSTARAWIDEQLVAHGLGPSLAVVPYRMWGISAVYRVECASGTYWFKAVFRGFAAEPVTTQYLHRLQPTGLPVVVAVDAERAWMLLAHVPGAPVSDDHAHTGVAVDALVSLQRALADHVDRLLADGVPDRRIAGLADDLRTAADLPSMHGVVDVTRDRLDHLTGAVALAAETVAAVGLPVSIVHGDFHPGNVLTDDGHVVIIDWSDAAISHPLVDLGAWGSWYRDDPEAMDALWEAFATAWSPDVPAATLLAARPMGEVVLAAYHFVSYAHIVQGLEPLRQEEAMSGARNFFADLVAAVARLDGIPAGEAP